MRDSHYGYYDPTPPPFQDWGAAITMVLIIAFIVALIVVLVTSANNAKKKKADAASDVDKLFSDMIADANTYTRVEAVGPLQAARKQMIDYVNKNWPDP